MPARNILLPLEGMWLSFTISTELADSMRKNGERSFNPTPIRQRIGVSPYISINIDGLSTQSNVLHLSPSIGDALSQQGGGNYLKFYNVSKTDTYHRQIRSWRLQIGNPIL